MLKLGESTSYSIASISMPTPEQELPAVICYLSNDVRLSYLDDGHIAIEKCVDEGWHNYGNMLNIHTLCSILGIPENIVVEEKKTIIVSDHRWQTHLIEGAKSL